MYFLLMLHVHLGSMGSSGHWSVRDQVWNDFQSHKGRTRAQHLNAAILKWDKSPSFPFHRQKLVAWWCLFSKRAEKAILPCAQNTDTWNSIWQAALITTEIYTSETKYLALLLLLQTNYILAPSPPSKGENPNPSPILNLKIYDLWVMNDNL